MEFVGVSSVIPVVPMGKNKFTKFSRGAPWVCGISLGLIGQFPWSPGVKIKNVNKNSGAPWVLGIRSDYLVLSSMSLGILVYAWVHGGSLWCRRVHWGSRVFTPALLGVAGFIAFRVGSLRRSKLSQG